MPETRVAAILNTAHATTDLVMEQWLRAQILSVGETRYSGSMITQHSACTLTRLPARTGKRTSARGNRWGLFPDTTSDLCAATSRELKTNRVKHGITETGTIGLPWLKRVLPCNASTGMSAVELTNRCDSTLAPAPNNRSLMNLTTTVWTFTFPPTKRLHTASRPGHTLRAWANQELRRRR